MCYTGTVCLRPLCAALGQCALGPFVLHWDSVPYALMCCTGTVCLRSLCAALGQCALGHYVLHWDRVP